MGVDEHAHGVQARVVVPSTIGSVLRLPLGTRPGLPQRLGASERQVRELVEGVASLDARAHGYAAAHEEEYACRPSPGLGVDPMLPRWTDDASVELAQPAVVDVSEAFA